MRTLPLMTSLVALATLATAQTPPDVGRALRGEVSFKPDSRAFMLKGTDIRLVSRSILLSEWLDTDVFMKVAIVSRPANPFLEVRWIEPTDKTFEMGNLVLGQPDPWRVYAPEGSFTMAFADFGWNVGYTPLLNESYLLGPNAQPLAVGFTDSLGVFKFDYQVPIMPAFIGVRIVGQAGVLPARRPLFLTNADSNLITA